MSCRCSAGLRRRQPGWLSEVWQTRRGRLFLVPGDSPLGFRLPLQSLPAIDPVDYPHLVPADPFAERTPLPDPRVTHPIGAKVLQTAHGEEPSPPLAPETLVTQQDPSRECLAKWLGCPGAHRSDRRSPRRPLVCVHAAGRNARRLSRTPRRRRDDGGRTLAAGACRRLRAAARSAACCDQSDARPRRDRGQYPPVDILAGSCGDHEGTL